MGAAAERTDTPANDRAEIAPFLVALKALGGLVAILGIEHEKRDGEMVLTMPIEQHHTGAPGVAHGGAVTTLLDSALGATAFQIAYGRGCMTSTVEIKVNFFRPARQGRKLVTTTRVESVGKSLLVVSGSAIDDESGEPVAFGVGTFNLYPADPDAVKAVEAMGRALADAAD